VWRFGLDARGVRLEESARGALSCIARDSEGIGAAIGRYKEYTQSKGRWEGEERVLVKGQVDIDACGGRASRSGDR
jgi:hypothetical protein